MVGIYLSVFQLEIFTAFLWLIECSVLFVFMLFLFYFNVKGSFNYFFLQSYQIGVFSLFLFCLIQYFDVVDLSVFVVQPTDIVENYYESFNNCVNNDLFGFAISYYILNIVELLVVGVILFIGSVICVNLYQINLSVRTQSYFNFLVVFNFLVDFSSFYFLRRQNLLKQGGVNSALKFFSQK